MSDDYKIVSNDSADKVATPSDKKPVEVKETTETREASGASEEEGEETEEREAKPEQDGLKKRIDKLTKKRADAERERDHWRDLALKNSQKPPEQTPKSPEEKKAAPTDGKPNKDDFKTHEEYLEALTDWKADRKIDEKLAKRDQKQKEDALRAEMEKSKKAHLDRVEAFRKDHEDFNDVLSEIADFRLSPSLERALLESDNGPELMYEFAKNPKELERINALEPSAQGRALGRFESSFQKAAPKGKEGAETETEEVEVEAKPKTKISKAPTPMKKVGSKAGNPKTIFDDDLSDADWIAMRNKQLGV